MRTHKIKNIDKAVCTVEQKIAYNIAFKAHIGYQDNFDKLRQINPGEANIACHNIRDFYIKEFQRLYPDNKANLDAVFHCLTNGLYNYMCKPFIAADYKTIGEAFPILYPQE